MSVPRPVVPGVYRVPLGIVNSYILIDESGAVVIVDTGTPGKETVVLNAVRSLGRSHQDVVAIILTHAHWDHVGSATALRTHTGAPLIAHVADAALLEAGKTIRPYTAAPSPIFRIAVAGLASSSTATIAPFSVDQTVQEGDELPYFGGLRVIHLPGHSAGQIGVLSDRHGGILVAGDVATHLFGLSWAVLYEDLALGVASAQRIGTLPVQVVCLGHGRPLLKDGAARFQRRFAPVL